MRRNQTPARSADGTNCVEVEFKIVACGCYSDRNRATLLPAIAYGDIFRRVKRVYSSI
jgi:hypothetical protein